MHEQQIHDILALQKLNSDTLKQEIQSVEKLKTNLEALTEQQNKIEQHLIQNHDASKNHDINLETVKENQDKLNTSIMDITANIVQLTTKMENIQTENKQLTEELERLTTAQNNATNQTVESITTNNNQQQIEIETIKTQLTDLQQTVEDVTKTHDFESIKSNLEQLDSQHRAFVEQSTQRETMLLEHLKNMADAVNKVTDELERTRQASQEMYTHLQESNARLGVIETRLNSLV